MTRYRADIWMDPRLGPRRQKKKTTQSFRFPCEYWYGPPGKSQSYPASIPSLASHRHRSKVQNYDAWCFILANDGLMLFCASRRLWRVYTFAKAYLSLRHCTKISCAASDGDFCSIHPGVKTLVSQHICAGVVTGQCIKYRLSLVIVPKYHMLARMAPGLRLQLDPYCRASFDSKSFAKVDVTDGQRDESRALLVLCNKTLLHKTCASYCHILLLLLYQGSSQLP